MHFIDIQEKNVVLSSEINASYRITDFKYSNYKKQTSYILLEMLNTLKIKCTINFLCR